MSTYILVLLPAAVAGSIQHLLTLAYPTSCERLSASIRLMPQWCTITCSASWPISLHPSDFSSPCKTHVEFTDPHRAGRAHYRPRRRQRSCAACLRACRQVLAPPSAIAHVPVHRGRESVCATSHRLACVRSQQLCTLLIGRPAPRCLSAPFLAARWQDVSRGLRASPPSGSRQPVCDAL